MRSTKRFLYAALAATVACVVIAPAEAQRWGGGKPVATSPGTKPTTGGRHWGGGHGGHWRGDHGGWSGRHHGHWRHHGHHHRHWGVWGLGLGIGFGWPYWGGWDYYPYGVPVAVVDGPVYVNPDPMPAYGESFRWYCPASAAYYPDVRECARPWLKVVPADRGPAPPPVTRDPAQPAEPSAPSAPSAPRSTSPSYLPEPTASAGTVRITAPRLTSPIEVAARNAPPTALAHNDTF